MKNGPVSNGPLVFYGHFLLMEVVIGMSISVFNTEVLAVEIFNKPMRVKKCDHNRCKYFKETFYPQVNHPPAPVFGNGKVSMLRSHMASQCSQSAFQSGATYAPWSQIVPTSCPPMNCQTFCPSLISFSVNRTVPVVVTTRLGIGGIVW